MKRGFIVLVCAGLGTLVGCLESPHRACHRRAIEQLGCCPFHGDDDCQGADTDAIKEACAEELSFAADPDEGGETGGGTATDVP